MPCSTIRYHSTHIPRFGKGTASSSYLICYFYIILYRRRNSWYSNGSFTPTLICWYRRESRCCLSECAIELYDKGACPILYLKRNGSIWATRACGLDLSSLGHIHTKTLVSRGYCLCKLRRVGLITIFPNNLYLIGIRGIIGKFRFPCAIKILLCLSCSITIIQLSFPLGYRNTCRYRSRPVYLYISSTYCVLPRKGIGRKTLRQCKDRQQ